MKEPLHAHVPNEKRRQSFKGERNGHGRILPCLDDDTTAHTKLQTKEATYQVTEWVYILQAAKS